MTKEKGPLKCWGFRGNHVLRDCPHQRENPQSLHNLEEVVIVEDMEKSTPQIYGALDNH